MIREDKLIDHMAQALCARVLKEPFEHQPSDVQDHYRQMARTAAAALRQFEADNRPRRVK